VRPATAGTRRAGAVREDTAWEITAAQRVDEPAPGSAVARQERNGESALPERAHSGALMRVESRDVYSAVAEAGAIADGFASRVAVGTHKDFAPLAKAFVKGCRAPPTCGPPGALTSSRSIVKGAHTLVSSRVLTSRTGRSEQRPGRRSSSRPRRLFLAAGRTDNDRSHPDRDGERPLSIDLANPGDQSRT